MAGRTRSATSKDSDEGGPADETPELTRGLARLSVSTPITLTAHQLKEKQPDITPAHESASFGTIPEWRSKTDLRFTTVPPRMKQLARSVTERYTVGSYMEAAHDFAPRSLGEWENEYIAGNVLTAHIENPVPVDFQKLFTAGAQLYEKCLEEIKEMHDVQKHLSPAMCYDVVWDTVIRKAYTGYIGELKVAEEINSYFSQAGRAKALDDRGRIVVEKAPDYMDKSMNADLVLSLDHGNYGKPRPADKVKGLARDKVRNSTSRDIQGTGMKIGIQVKSSTYRPGMDPHAKSATEVFRKNFGGTVYYVLYQVDPQTNTASLADRETFLTTMRDIEASFLDPVTAPVIVNFKNSSAKHIKDSIKQERNDGVAQTFETLKTHFQFVLRESKKTEPGQAVALARWSRTTAALEDAKNELRVARKKLESTRTRISKETVRTSSRSEKVRKEAHQAKQLLEQNAPVLEHRVDRAIEALGVAQRKFDKDQPAVSEILKRLEQDFLFNKV